MPICRLDRTILSLKGENASAFLNGLITNSIGNDLTFAALLTPQGKIIADFFIHRLADDNLVLETPETAGKALLMRLKMYRLRAKIEIEDISADYNIYALWDRQGQEGTEDPRLATLGERLLTSERLDPSQSANDYDEHRLKHGVPDSQWDFVSEEIFPHTANMDMLAGVDFKKGCFIGQEVVSRMQRKTEVRKRLRPIKLSGLAKPGDWLIAGERLVGEIRHVRNAWGMALVRLDRLAESGQDVRVNDHTIELPEPAYVRDHS